MNFILTVTLFIIMIVTIVITNYDLIHPAVIFSALWFVSSFFYWLMANQWNEPCSFETFVFILASNLLCIASMVSCSGLRIKVGIKYSLLKREKKVEKSERYKCLLEKWKRRFLFLLLSGFYAVSTKMMFTRVIELASMASKYNSATNVVYLARISEINGVGFGRLYINIMRLNIAIGIVLAKKVADLAFSHKKGYGLYIPFLLYSVFFSLIRGSRNDMMYILGAYLFIFIYYIYKDSTNRKKNAKKAFGYLVFFMVTMVIVWGISGFLFDRVGTSAMKSVIGYVGGPFAGFNYLLNHPNSIQSNYFGQNTFDSIYKMLSRLRIINFSLASVYLPYAGNPNFSINVYTMYGRYFSDFGVVGSIFLTLFFGQFYGVLYGKLKFSKGTKAESKLILIYAIFMFPLIMSFFEDKFYSYVNNTLFLVFFVLLLEQFVFSDHKLFVFHRRIEIVGK